MENTRLIIRAGQLYDGRSLHTDRTVVVEGSHITEVTDKSGSWDLEGIVTPAFIDPHSHIGMERRPLERNPAQHPHGSCGNAQGIFIRHLSQRGKRPDQKGKSPVRSV